jgi:hypothetical protein
MRAAPGKKALHVAALAAACTIGETARAQEDAEPMSIAYEAPAGCPDAGTFSRELAARRTHLRSARLGERARTLHVAVTKRGLGFAGRLWIEERAISSSPREVTGTACADVTSALSLIAAVAVESKATIAQRHATGAPPDSTTAPDGGANSQTTSDRAAGEPAPEASPAATTSSDAGSGQPAGERPPKRPAPDAAPASVTPAGADDESRATERLLANERPHGPPVPIHFAGGVQLEMSTIADAVFAGRVFGELEIGRPARSWAPSFRLALTRSLDTERSAGVGSATLRLAEASLEACPFKAKIATFLAVRPCVGASAGVLEAQGKGVSDGLVHSRPWATVFAHWRLVWGPLRVLAFELDAGAFAPLYRDSFVFDPDVPVYRAPPVAFVARLGFAVRFP